ncbi:GNAT family N-acetyltransferase [Bifidobacterium avesanii]|uniref:GNAT family N-acetyltransferase n=1 Tax=Bifidobacterium avesanii TaxID=1798157 RepID=A0A7K3TH36_9BIFI|nr:GNAT family N-acetyltransferase [Bifidobacterium avesanii]NEG78401.1 GNAT family N-acetyltransferase [Bifidobacterium avesanii]
MEIRAYDHAPEDARAIRLAAFTALADVRPEFDRWDGPGSGAVHLLAFLRLSDGSRPAATCRFYADSGTGSDSGSDSVRGDRSGRYVIARLAVEPTLQGHGIGTRLLADAESRIRRVGGRVAAVHAARDMFPYYERLGYAPTADMYDGGSHGWLAKALD